MKRVTPKTLAERQANKSKFTDLPKLKDILVDLSVKNTPKVVRKLRLIGPAVEFSEIQEFLPLGHPDIVENRKKKISKLLSK